MNEGCYHGNDDNNGNFFKCRCSIVVVVGTIYCENINVGSKHFSIKKKLYAAQTR